MGSTAYQSVQEFSHRPYQLRNCSFILACFIAKIFKMSVSMRLVGGTKLLNAGIV